MPWIIDYQAVLEQMKRQHFRCHYYNSGAFGFGDMAHVRTIGLIGEPDATLKPMARELARHVASPFTQTLAGILVSVWQSALPGRAWVMPMSHWAYELDFGSRDWMPAVLERIDIDPGLLQDRNNGAAIEFSSDEMEKFEYFVNRLLEMLASSDFMVAFPGRQALCTLHHHKQLWWMTTEAQVIEAIDRAAPRL